MPPTIDADLLAALPKVFPNGPPPPANSDLDRRLKQDKAWLEAVHKAFPLEPTPNVKRRDFSIPSQEDTNKRIPVTLLTYSPSSSTTPTTSTKPPTAEPTTEPPSKDPLKPDEPNKKTPKTPLVLHIHCGGTISFSSEDWIFLCSSYVQATKIPFLTVDYTLSQYSSYPTQLFECFDVLSWIVGFANEDDVDDGTTTVDAGDSVSEEKREKLNLNIDINKIAIMGESAGGLLSTALVHVVNHLELSTSTISSTTGTTSTQTSKSHTPRTSLKTPKGHPFKIAKQILIHPMLDHTTSTLIADTDLLSDGVPLSWSYEDNEEAWKILSGGLSLDERKKVLGREDGFRGLPGYIFSPSLFNPSSTNVDSSMRSSLPKTYIDIGELDIFKSEAVAYAKLLQQPSVTHGKCEVHIYPGLTHMGEITAPKGELSRKAFENRCAALMDLW